MRKEFEIQGCIEVPPEVTEDEFWDVNSGCTATLARRFSHGVTGF